jgi:site-specific recombinase XerD
MTAAPRKRRHHFKSVRLSDPAITPFGQWPPANRTFYAAFRQWLIDSGYADSTVQQYGTAARIALGWLNKPHWAIDVEADLERVRVYVTERPQGNGTRQTYLKGLAKFETYLRRRRDAKPKQKPINWPHYVSSLPAWLSNDVRAYVAHHRRGWPIEARHESTISLLSQTTRYLRWAVSVATLDDLATFAPALWHDYVDHRLDHGISPVTLNIELSQHQSLLLFLAEQGRQVCQRMLRVEPLDPGSSLPRDVPCEHVRLLWQEIERDANHAHTNPRRLGIMDRAWFLLMVLSGLRTCEVRRMQLPDLDLAARTLRVNQSKGLKDRVVYLGQPAIEALEVYLAQVRGPAPSEHVFVYRQRPLTRTYCRHRLCTYGERCGLHVTPHQLRHTAATLLLNAGAPLPTVQHILGHRRIDTTLSYTRLYDPVVAADYYRAMQQIEAQMGLEEDSGSSPLAPGTLLALLDSLHEGTLNEGQKETLGTLRAGILALAEEVGRGP